MSRKLLLIAGPLLLVVLAVASVGMWLPALVRGRVEAALSRRFRVPARVAEAQVELSEVRLRGIEIGSASVGRLGLAELRAQGSLTSALFEGTRAYRVVHASGLRLRLTLGDALTRELARMARTRRAQRRSGGPTVPRVLVWTLSDFDCSLRDSQGELLALTGSKASGTAQLASIDLSQLTLGAAPGAAASLADVSAQLQRAQGKVRISAIEIGGATLTLPTLPERSAPVSPSPEETSATPGTETRDSVTAAAEPESDRASATDSAQQQGATYAAHVGQHASGLLARLRAVRGALRSRSSASGRKVEREPGEESHPQRFPLMTWLTDAGAVSWAKTSVIERGAPNVAPVLGKLEGRLERRGDRELLFEGAGTAQDGGTMRWNMRLWPEELRAEGELGLQALSLSLLAPLLPKIPWHGPSKSRLNAKLVIKTESVQRLRLQGRAEIVDAGVYSERIAKEPIRGISAALSGQGSWYPEQRRLEIDAGRVAMGQAAIELRGAVEWAPDHYLFDLHAELKPTACTAAIHALPKDMLGELAAFSWQGTLAGQSRLLLDSRQLEEAALELDINDGCEFTAAPVTADLRRFRMPFEHSALEPDGTMFTFETGPGTPAWTPIEQISPYMVHAVVAHEDLRFFRHKGFAPTEIRNALVKNLKAGEYRVGASTITMQLVKNLLLRREKTLRRKVQEAILTWWIERMLEKREILELYLNVIEYGPSVYGIRHAAEYYFKRLPRELSPAESVFLASILPNPKGHHVHAERGRLSPPFLVKLKRMMKRMQDRGWYSEPAATYGSQELEAFQFHLEATDPLPPRVIPGGASPLPYEQDAAAWEALSWAWTGL